MNDSKIFVQKRGLLRALYPAFAACDFGNGALNRELQLARAPDAEEGGPQLIHDQPILTLAPERRQLCPARFRPPRLSTEKLVSIRKELLEFRDRVASGEQRVYHLMARSK